MASDHWQSKSSLDELTEQPYRFDFFAALRLVECQASAMPRIGAAVRPSDENLRLTQKPRMDFVPSTLASAEWKTTTQKWEIDCQFFGMFGPQGALPIELTEYAMGRIRDFRDDSMNRFIDCFFHRLASLFYRTVASLEPTIQFDRPDEDRISVYLGSIAGYGTSELHKRDQMPDLAKLQFAGHLSQQNHHAEGLGQVLAGMFRADVKVDQFVGCWLPLPESEQLKLGVAARSDLGSLGQTTTIGSQVWECQQCIRISVGPLGLKEYLEFLPKSRNIGMLRDVVRNYAGLALAWRARVSLRKEDVPELKLGAQAKLGWSSWLKCDDFQNDAEDLEIRSEQVLEYNFDPEVEQMDGRVAIGGQNGMSINQGI